MNARVLAEGGAGTPLVYVPGIDGTGELLLGLTPRLEACFRLVRLAYDVREPRADGYAELAASVAEDVAVLGVVWYAIDHPRIAAAIAAVLLVVGLTVLYFVAKLIRRGWRRWKGKDRPGRVPASA